MPTDNAEQPVTHADRSAAWEAQRREQIIFIARNTTPLQRLQVVEQMITALMDRLTPVNAEAAAMKAQIPVPFVPVERAARLVLHGVARKRMVIAFPGYVRQLAFMHRFLPGLFARFAAKQVAQFRTIRGTTRAAGQ